MALLPAEAPPAHEAVADFRPRLAGAVPRGLRRRTDERLVCAARDGDERAIEVLFERHASPILRYCRSLVRSDQEAEDVRQEVFVLAISALRRGAEPRTFRPWLYRIAHNACMTHLRARRPVLVAEGGVLLERATEEPIDGHREELRQLLDDIAELPDVQRGALLLREMDGFSYEQVGEVLGVPQSTVRASIFRARRTLQGLAEARDADCEAIQAELGELADRRGRRNRRITHHLRVCSTCRAYRDELRRRPAVLGVDAGLALAPLVPLGALVALKGKLFGGASAGAVVATGAGGGVTKVAAVASTCALLAAGGMEAEHYLGMQREQRPNAVRVEHGGTMPARAGRAQASAPAAIVPAAVAAVPAAGAVPQIATPATGPAVGRAARRAGPPRGPGRGRPPRARGGAARAPRPRRTARSAARAGAALDSGRSALERAPARRRPDGGAHPSASASAPHPGARAAPARRRHLLRRRSALAGARPGGARHRGADGPVRPVAGSAGRRRQRSAGRASVDRRVHHADAGARAPGDDARPGRRARDADLPARRGRGILGHFGPVRARRHTGDDDTHDGRVDDPRRLTRRSRFRTIPTFGDLTRCGFPRILAGRHHKAWWTKMVHSRFGGHG